MQFGAIFPHKSIEPDAGAIRAYACGVEEMGFSHIASYDHVIGANQASRPDWRGIYDLDSRFHEPFALLSFLAGVTTRIGLATGILILPQRQTVLVAKQAATLDLLCEGRLRLGVGTGWNQVEYEALGMPFERRGAMLDEQVEVLRALWTERAVTFATPLHQITDAGIYPLPVQQPIPLWFGGGGIHPVHGAAHASRVLRRIARLGDGWMPTFDPDDQAEELVSQLHDLCRDHGRDPGSIGIEALLLASVQGNREIGAARHGQIGDWTQHARAWQRLGATHLAISSMVDGIEGVEGHLARLDEVRAVLREAGLWLN